MSWSTEHAEAVGEPLVAPGMRFTLWDYECDAGEDRLATNDAHVVSLMLSGDCDALVRHDLGDRYSEFRRLGSLLMTPAHVPIHTIGRPFRTRVARLEVLPGRFAALERLASERVADRLMRCTDIPGATIRIAMRRLATEVDSPGLRSDLLLEGIGTTIVVDLLRYLEKGLTDEAEASTGYVAGASFTVAEIRAIADFIEANLGRRISVANIAAHFDLSERHFSRRFRAATGQSVSRFIEQVRLQHARKLLSDRRLSIKEIAYRMGFASLANFSDAFLRQCGERPRAYRQRRAETMDE